MKEAAAQHNQKQDTPKHDEKHRDLFVHDAAKNGRPVAHVHVTVK
jgi:hypothetical protein